MSGKLAVLGSGSWGTALAIHLARVGFEVRLWARREEFAEQLRRGRENEEYLPGARLPDNVEPTSSIQAAAECEVAVMVVPSHGFRPVVRSFLEAWDGRGGPTIVSATKGIETETTARMSQVCFEEGMTADREVRFAVLSGPNFAAEVAAGIPSAAVVASRDGHLASDLRERFATPGFRFYSSSDVVGVELGGAAKNVIAIAAGLVTGLELGHNTLAALITRGLHEMTRLGIAFGGQPRTFSGLAGLGDLVLTCTGGLSRNRRTGIELASGRSLEEIQADTQMVAEGVRNSMSMRRLSEKKGIEMPIVEQVMAVLYEAKQPRAALEDLMTRELKSETEL